MDLTKEIDRAGTASIKWSLIQQLDDHTKWINTKDYFGDDRILPMWVADMDFRSPEPVIEALNERVSHGIFGYTQADDEYFDAVKAWMLRRNNWQVEQEWILTTAGVVPALHMLVRSLTERGDKVLIQRPVYYPFFSAVEKNKRQLVSNSLIVRDGRYEIDFDDLQKKVADSKTKVVILCNPHNPVGRVWTRAELTQFGHICRENNVIVISDEIHGDLIFPDSEFIPFAGIEDFGEFTVTCTAPSKTFNLAGLQTSNIIIQNRKIRRLYRKTLEENGLMSANALGLVACKAAYNHGEEWLQKLMQTLHEHRAYIEKFFTESLPDFYLHKTEGTYLAWFDCRELGLHQMDLRKKFLKDARIFLDDGFIFGEEGQGFQRLNFACPLSVLEDALVRIRKAFYQ